MKRTLVGLALVTGFLACRQMLSAGWNDTDFTVDAASVAVTQAAGSVVVGQDGTPVFLPVKLDHDALNPHTQLVMTRLDPPSPGGADDGGLPNGLTATLVRTDDAGDALVELLASDASPASSKPLIVGLVAKNTDTGQVSAQQQLEISIAVVAAVGPGDGGTWNEFVSTSLQPADFQEHIPDIATLATLTKHQQPVHVQIFDTLWTGPSEDAAVWDSGRLDSFVTQLVDAGQEVQLEIFTPPHIADHFTPGANPSLDHYDYTAGVAEYADYCAAIVAHFNGDGGVPGILPPGRGVHWWSLRGDDNTGGAPADYVSAYNSAVAEMRKIDQTIRFAGPESSDQVDNVGSTLPGNEMYPGYLNPFVNAPDAGGAIQIDAIAVHMYSASLPTTADQQVLGTIPQFAQHIVAIRQDLAGPLQNLPIWVTQTNVNSAVPLNEPDGQVVFQGATATTFAPDPRGTNTFYAAWAPYMFSQLGQHGNNGFFHWAYTAGHNADGSGADLNPQNAEVHYDPDDAGVYEKYVSYWVDYELAQMLPPAGQSVFSGNPTDPSVDVLPLQNQDGGSFTVMVTDIASENDTVSDGGGLPRTVLVDLSQVIPSCDHVKATVTTIDSLDHLDTGPIAAPSFSPQPGCRFPVILRGYGVAFLQASAQ